MPLCANHHSAVVNRKVWMHQRARNHFLMMEKEAWLHQRTRGGLLAHPAQKQHWENVSCLVPKLLSTHNTHTQRPDVSNRDAQGRNVLHLAAQENNSIHCALLIYYVAR
eukprot:1154472-Pelagomonas_calceolata.AAC.8